MGRCFTNCANKPALERAQVGVEALRYFCWSARGRAGEELIRLPVAFAAGVSIPWASFPLTINLSIVDSQPVHMCFVGFCVFVEGNLVSCVQVFCLHGLLCTTCVLASKEA